MEEFVRQMQEDAERKRKEEEARNAGLAKPGEGAVLQSPLGQSAPATAIPLAQATARPDQMELAKTMGFNQPAATPAGNGLDMSWLPESAPFGNTSAQPIQTPAGQTVQPLVQTPPMSFPGRAAFMQSAPAPVAAANTPLDDAISKFSLTPQQQGAPPESAWAQFNPQAAAPASPMGPAPYQPGMSIGTGSTGNDGTRYQPRFAEPPAGQGFVQRGGTSGGKQIGTYADGSPILDAGTGGHTESLWLKDPTAESGYRMAETRRTGPNVEEAGSFALRQQLADEMAKGKLETGQDGVLSLEGLRRKIYPGYSGTLSAEANQHLFHTQQNLANNQQDQKLKQAELDQKMEVEKMKMAERMAMAKQGNTSQAEKDFKQREDDIKKFKDASFGRIEAGGRSVTDLDRAIVDREVNQRFGGSTQQGGKNLLQDLKESNLLPSRPGIRPILGGSDIPSIGGQPISPGQPAAASPQADLPKLAENMGLVNALTRKTPEMMALADKYKSAEDSGDNSALAKLESQLGSSFVDLTNQNIPAGGMKAVVAHLKQAGVPHTFIDRALTMEAAKQAALASRYAGSDSPGRIDTYGPLSALAGFVQGAGPLGRTTGLKFPGGEEISSGTGGYIGKVEPYVKTGTQTRKFVGPYENEVRSGTVSGWYAPDPLLYGKHRERAGTLLEALKELEASRGSQPGQ